MDEKESSVERQRRFRIVVTGMVQGVGFRYATVRQAGSLQLGGWVRNRSDGSVEVLAEGPWRDVSALIDWCHIGPPGARVTAVREREEPIDRPLVGFDIRY